MATSPFSPTEQVKPLAPSSRYSVRSHDLEDDVASLHIKLSQRKYVHCCGLVSAMFSILAVIAIVLGFTVFHVKCPKITMNHVTLDQFNASVVGSNNITLLADVSIKNPNVASFRYENTSTWVYYYGDVVGEGTSPSGVAKARRTIRMNLTVEVEMAKVTTAPEFKAEFAAGALTVRTFTRARGKVKVVMVKRNVVVEMNCTITYNITNGEIEGGNKCKRRVRL